MKRKSIYITIFTLVILFICFIAIMIFTLPSLNTYFNLTSDSKANIGTTISGITSPIIGIFSALLVYLAFTTQTDSNKEQRLKNESDILFLLINQFYEEVSQFRFESKKGDTTIEQTGIVGLNKYTKVLKFGGSFANANITFKQIEESKYINLYVDSFNLIKKRIEISPLSIELKELFTAKLNSYYYTILRLPLKFITEIAEENPNLKDSLTDKIEMLYKKQLETY